MIGEYEYDKMTRDIGNEISYAQMVSDGQMNDICDWRLGIGMGQTVNTQF
jgi:hypothetical protein